jgi:hypothetical protein
MSSSESQDKVSLIVDVADPGTEVFVSNARMQLVGQGLGGYRAELPPGIYQIRLRAGCASKDEVVVLRPGQGQMWMKCPPLDFGSPVPLAATSAAALIDAAVRQSRKLTRRIGHDASIFVFARCAAGRPDHPARGLTLLDAARRPLADFERESDRGLDADAWSACRIAVNPGAYIVRVQLDVHAVEQALIVPRGYQVQVFLHAADRQRPQPDLSHGAILYAPDGEFDPARWDMRVAELARIGLSSRRPAIADETLDAILAGKFDNPMLGIMAAHLALDRDADRKEDRTRTMLPALLRNLRKTMTLPHPDVEALALLVDDLTVGYQFDWPPMLRRSWAIVVRASAGRDNLIRAGGWADRIVGRVWGAEPWLQWLSPAPDDEEVPRSFTIGAEAATEATTTTDDVYLAALSAHLQALATPPGPHRGGRRGPASAKAPAALDGHQVEQLIAALGVPRRHLERLLDRLGLRGLLQKRGEPSTSQPSSPHRGTVMSDSGTLKPSDAVRAAFTPVLAALDKARRSLAAVKDVIDVRPGYQYPDTGAPIPAVVVAVLPSTTPVKAADMAKQLGVPVEVIDANVDEQMAALEREKSTGTFGAAAAPPSPLEVLLTGEEAADFGPPKTGAYEPLDPPKLPLVDETMDVTICVSPEAGWQELERFLAGTEERLTVAMYQFTAPHIFAAVKQAVEPAGRRFELVLHPVPEKPAASGVKAHDLKEQDQVLKPLRDDLGNRFQFSWATLKTKAHPDGLWASAYHIKVAVRDGKTFWLSSGNWQSSNQPDVHPWDKGARLPAGFQRKYNRDYHAVITNDKLAAAYETYIQRDYELTSAQGEAQPFAMPDLFIPEEEPEEPEPFAAPPQLFKPLVLNRRIKVQPLLTPDNYAKNALDLIKSAKKSVWFQNQYINFRGTGEDFAEFRLLVTALKDQIDAGRDVRIICRDMMKQESVDVLTALGFPREVMRFQPACHNKTIIIDGKVVMFGSHNWSNEGVSTNRDASLIFFDEEIAKYLAQVYDYDWKRLATAKPTAKRPRVAREGEPTPPGQRRVPHSAVFED